MTVLINKRSSVAEYVILRFGLLLEQNDYFALPWSALRYDAELGGYHTNITELEIEGAPPFSLDDENTPSFYPKLSRLTPAELKKRQLG